MTDQPAPQVEHSPQSLTLTWDDGARHRFDAIWLRDNAFGADYRHVGNDQRLFDIADLPSDLAITQAHIDDEGALILRFAPEGETLVFNTGWLRRHAYDAVLAEGWPDCWDGRMANRLTPHDYSAVRDQPSALFNWLDTVRRDGFALLKDVPTTGGHVCSVAELFGFVRETNYGRLFDVISEPDPSNMAFTAAGLGVHTDNPYRDPVPGLQLLHCLRADGEGGASIVVDGYEAARRLRETAPDDYDLLRHWRVAFRYQSGDTDLCARRALIESDAGGQPLAIAYNNRSIAPLDLPGHVMADYYRAYRHFSEILRAPDLRVRFQMGPGDLFIVDNRRVMHGREGYAPGARHLQGCYADWDGLISRHRVLQRTLNQEAP